MRPYFLQITLKARLPQQVRLLLVRKDTDSSDRWQSLVKVQTGPGTIPRKFSFLPSDHLDFESAVSAQSDELKAAFIARLCVFHSQVQKVHSPNLLREIYKFSLVRIGTIMNLSSE